MYNQTDHSVLMNAYELAAYLGISQNAAYVVLHKTDFPTVQIGSLLYAVREEVDVWIARQAEKGGYEYEPEKRPR